MVTAKYTKMLEQPQHMTQSTPKVEVTQSRGNANEVREEPLVHIPVLLLLSATSLDPSHNYDIGTW
jgi:hypothetical protein